MTSADAPILRLLIVMPSWVGDAVMATPTLRLVRAAFPGIFIGGLVRPGIDELLAGTDFFDELHVAHGTGVMGPKHVAAKIRPRRYDTVLLLANSFSSALAVRVAGIQRRLGYSRDARGFLLTRSIDPPKRPDGRWAIVPAVNYYLTAATELLLRPRGLSVPVAPPAMELATTPQEERAADEILTKAALELGARFAVLNPGGNNPAKRWPAERFAAVADHLANIHRLAVLINGSPAERDLAAHIASLAASSPIVLPDLGVTLGSLKAVVRRAALMVTNDTGPRHLAAAFGVPLVSLFGPTDPRWTTIPTRPGAPETIFTADPALPESETADDHPDRCRIDRIEIEPVVRAIDAALTR